MIVLRKIKPVWKGKRLMTLIVLASSKQELQAWRNKNKNKFKTIFYGSPRKDQKGYYALIEQK